MRVPDVKDPNHDTACSQQSLSPGHLNSTKWTIIHELRTLDRLEIIL